MVAMTSYTVECERDEGGWWAARVPEVPGAFTQAKRLEQIRERAREAIAAMLDGDVEEIDVVVVPILTDEIQAVVQRCLEARRAADEAQRAASETVRTAAKLLVEGGHLSMRDAATILGVSHQRVGQLV